MSEDRTQQIRAAIEEGWEGWFTGYHGSMDVTAARLAYEAGWRQQEDSFKALLADQDRAIDALAAAREERGRYRVALDAIRAGAAVNRGQDAVWGEIAGAALAGQEPDHPKARSWLNAARARFAEEDGEPTTHREDELAHLRGLLLQAGAALLSAMHGRPVDDSVLNDIEAALPQGIAREDGDGW